MKKTLLLTLTLYCLLSLHGKESDRREERTKVTPESPAVLRPGPPILSVALPEITAQGTLSAMFGYNGPGHLLFQSEPVGCDEYSLNRRAFRKPARHEPVAKPDTAALSDYDDFLKEGAKKLGWDWRLLASLVYQESRFKPDTKSHAGAVGLMQLMPRTGKAHGATNLADPQDNIRAGTEYLKWLDERWAGLTDEEQRLKFILASYNAGKGHVDDARRLAKKNNKDPDIWDDNVADYMPALAKKEYFNDEVVKYGYCRGGECVRFVKGVLERYSHYKSRIELADGTI